MFSTPELVKVANKLNLTVTELGFYENVLQNLTEDKKLSFLEAVFSDRMETLVNQ